MDVTGHYKTVLVKLFLMAFAIQIMFAKAVQEQVNDNPEKNQFLSTEPISTTEYDEDLRRDVSTTEYDDDLRKAVEKYLLNEDHRHLRQMLKLAVKRLERDSYLNENEKNAEEYVTSSEMPFYFDHIWSIVNGDVKKSSRRRHQKRSSFDSIAHQGGLGGFGNTHRKQKLEFTFENLLPFLLEGMRRNSREVGGRNY